MQSLLKDLTSPLDEVAGYVLWYRLGPDLLADAITIASERRQCDVDVTYAITRDSIRKFIAEQRRVDEKDRSKLLNILAAPGALLIGDDLSALPMCSIELWHEHNNSTEGWLLVTGGHKELITHDKNR